MSQHTLESKLLEPPQNHDGDTARQQPQTRAFISRPVIWSIAFASIFLAVMAFFIPHAGVTKWFMAIGMSDLSAELLWHILIASVPLQAAFLFFRLRIKARFVKLLPTEVSLLQANPETFPPVNPKRLEEETAALTALGFRPERYYAMQIKTGRPPRRIARLFLNEQQRCYAVLSVRVGPETADGEQDLLCFIQSRLSDDWQLSTSNNRLVFLDWLLRRPRSLWRRLPDMSASELVQDHLALRSQMIEDLGLFNLDISADAFIDRLSQNVLDMRVRLKKRCVIGILRDINKWYYHPRFEWLGNYPRLARARQR
jgi:hypothetical protein